MFVRTIGYFATLFGFRRNQQQKLKGWFILPPPHLTHQ